MRLYLLCAVAAVLVLASGCTFFDTTCDEGDRECLGNPLFAKGLGGDCKRTAECKAGLSCIDGSCEATGETDRGDACRLTAECGNDDYCGSRRICALAGDVQEGGECETTGMCGHGLVCEAPDLSQMGTLSLSKLAQITGLCEEAGDKEQGEPCRTASECLAGLACLELEAGEGKHCLSLTPSDFEVPAIPLLWEGVECAEVEEGDDRESYFEVPRGGDEPGEFYSLPYPNDIRLEGGRIDLADHPVPPENFDELPFVKRYIEVAGEDLAGFSTNPVIYFRFSHPYDFRTIDRPGLNIKIVDITPSSPEYDTEAGIEWKTTSGELSNYICPHWLAMQRPVGTPLRPATTYAAIVTTGVKPCGEKDEDGNCMGGGNFARGADFSAMLDGSAPSDPDVRAAWEKYEPLREWIADSGENEGAILNAAVFTTQEPEALMPALREAIHDDDVPTISDLTECTSASTASPCAVGERGRCQAASSDFREVHGRISLPIFQQGTPPYLDPEDGGGFELDASDAPVIQRHEDVCFAMSVPTAPAPAAGYPVLVFAHGTGGSFTGEMDGGGFAQTLATASVPAVVVAIDLPQHGERRGDSEEEPESLFYNFLNPRAARDNVLQGAADLMSVVRWVREGGLVVDGDMVAFDTTRIALMGHSQGSTHTALMAPYEPDAIGVVLSGNGGHLATSMLTKTNPVDIASVVPIGLLDPDQQFKLAGDRFNPALSIIQSVFDRADPINYARRMYRDPAALAPTGHHLFMTYGRGDTYSPEETQRAYALAGNLPLVEPVLEDVPLVRVDPPVSENVGAGGTPRTVGMRQYAPTGSVDGHFVGVRQGQDGRADVDAFLDGLLAGGAPAIGGP